MDDVRTVMEAVGSERAALVGTGDGAMMAATFAATFPERVTALVLVNAMARMSWAPDYPIGIAPERQQMIINMVEQRWGGRDLLAATNPSLLEDVEVLDSWARFLRLAASPATAAAVIRTLFRLDIRQVLPAIQAPTLVVHRRDNVLVSVKNGRVPRRAHSGRALCRASGRGLWPRDR